MKNKKIKFKNFNLQNTNSHCVLAKLQQNFTKVSSLHNSYIKMKQTCTKSAFSLIELTISLIVISIISAVFAPIVIKRIFSTTVNSSSISGLSTNPDDCREISLGCTKCINDKCIECNGSVGYYLDVDYKCVLKECPSTCDECETRTKCTQCKAGYHFYQGNADLGWCVSDSTCSE